MRALTGNTAKSQWRSWTLNNAQLDTARVWHDGKTVSALDRPSISPMQPQHYRRNHDQFCSSLSSWLVSPPSKISTPYLFRAKIFMKRYGVAIFLAWKRTSEDFSANFSRFWQHSSPFTHSGILRFYRFMQISTWTASHADSNQPVRYPLSGPHCKIPHYHY